MDRRDSLGSQPKTGRRNGRRAKFLRQARASDASMLRLGLLLRRSNPRGRCERSNWQLSSLVWMRGGRARGSHTVPEPPEGSRATQKTGVGTGRSLGGRGGPPARPLRGALRNLIVKLYASHERGRHAITAAPTKRPRTLRVLQPAVVTVTEGSAWTPVATELYLRKGQTWFALIWPQREQRYFFVSPPPLLVLRDGAGETELTLSGSTKSGSAAFVGFRRRPVLRAAREGFGFGAGAGGGGGICGIARSSSSRSKESKRKPSPSINGWVASSI